MTSTTRPSITPGARSPRAYAWLLALAVGPGLAAVSCGDDDTVDPGGSGAGSGGASSGAAGAGGSTSSGAGAGGGANATAGSAGADNSGGNAGSTGLPDAGGSSGDTDASTAAFTLTSPAFDGQDGCGPGDDADACDLFPDETTDFAGDNVSPQLDWSGAPAGTQSFAIALHDLSFTQGGDPFTHWVMWNIPASATGLPGALPDGQEPGVPDDDTRQVSIGDDDGFFGSGAAGNVYEFVLYALSEPSIDPETDDPDAVEQFIEELDAEVIGTATLRARSTPDE